LHLLSYLCALLNFSSLTPGVCTLNMEYRETDAWVVVDSFFQTHGIVGQQISSYNDFISKTVPNILDEMPAIEVYDKEGVSINICIISIFEYIRVYIVILAKSLSRYVMNEIIRFFCRTGIHSSWSGPLPKWRSPLSPKWMLR
jgi:hypothetical protein